MKPRAKSGSRNSATTRRGGYLLVEALVYIGVVFIVLAVAYAAMYRSIDNSMVLRRNADDILGATHSGEVWRADVRSAKGPPRLEPDASGGSLVLTGPRGEIGYRFAYNKVFRRIGSGPWLPLVENVKSSRMMQDPRQKVTAWRWELELQPRAKGSTRASRVVPLFTFVAVPAVQPERMTAMADLGSGS